MNITDDLIMNAKVALGKLTKVRVVNKTKKPDSKTKLVNTWPLFYDNVNTDVINYLKSIGINPQKKPFVVCYSISYEEYNNCYIRANYNNTELVYARTYIELLRIKRQIDIAKNFKITIAHDPDVRDVDALPVDSNDIDKINDLADYSDVLILLNCPDTGWNAKITGNIAPFFFLELNWLNNVNFYYMPRVHSISKNIANGDRANRLITFDLYNFKGVSKQTMDNIYKSIEFLPWCEPLREIVRKNEINKHNKKMQGRKKQRP